MKETVLEMRRGKIRRKEKPSGGAPLTIETGSLFQIVTNNVRAHGRAQFGKPFGDVRGGQIGPNHLRVHGITCGVILQHHVKLIDDLRTRFDYSLSAAPFFRTFSGGTSGRL